MKDFKKKLILKKVKEELKIKDGKIIVDPSSCDGCESCISVCPSSALSLKELTKEEVKELPFKGRIKVMIKGKTKAYVSDYDKCTACGLCMKQCHEFAIHKVKNN